MITEAIQLYEEDVAGRSPLTLNPPQQAIVDRGLLTSGFNTILQLPTGAGKTWLAEQAIRATLSSGQRAIYLTPLRALANELVERWTHRFSDFSVGVFTGEYGQRQSYPVPFDRAHLLVMTPERLDACTRNWRSHWGWLPQVGLLVVDEFHLLGEKGRGSRLEGALMRVRALNPFLQVIGLSATMGNRPELADWLGGVHYGSNWRPIPVAWRFARYQRATDKAKLLAREIQSCIESGGQSVVFVQSRRRAEQLSAQLREAGIAAGHHHAGLDGSDRRGIEQEYRAGALRALVSTGTLEMGLNLPARQVVLYDLQAFDGTDFVPLPVNTVWQRAGRAGRMGLDTQGEVVLLAPSWDRTADRYAHGTFEKIQSRLNEPKALAEQVLAEVSSGFARTRAQLHRRFTSSLAAHQRRLPNLDDVLGEMLASDMIVEVRDEDERAPKLKATRLGRIAVRQMLAPCTIVTLSKTLKDADTTSLTFFDILLLCAQTNDCEPLIPADFEELEELGERLSREPCTWFQKRDDQHDLSGQRGRQLLAAIKTALVARAWTRIGCADRVANEFGCYPFEIRRLAESLVRILTAAIAVVTPPRKAGKELTPSLPVATLDDQPLVAERVRALAAMVAHGVDEHAVTLTYIDGIGGKLARRLRNAGYQDIEDLAQADCDKLAQVPGVSRTRAARWIDEADNKINVRSAYSFRETPSNTQIVASEWNSDIDPYRLRRSLELAVQEGEDAFVVTGGLEPHRVTDRNDQLACDCLDFAKGNECKHVLAVRLSRDDPALAPFRSQLFAQSGQEPLDLFRLWFDRQ